MQTAMSHGSRHCVRGGCPGAGCTAAEAHSPLSCHRLSTCSGTQQLKIGAGTAPKRSLVDLLDRMLPCVARAHRHRVRLRVERTSASPGGRRPSGGDGVSSRRHSRPRGEDRTTVPYTSPYTRGVRDPQDHARRPPSVAGARCTPHSVYHTPHGIRHNMRVMRVMSVSAPHGQHHARSHHSFRSPAARALVA